MNGSVKLRIRTVIANVFGVPPDSVDDSTSPETVEGWDSLHHIHLILALEGEFSVSLDPERAVSMTNFASIYEGLIEAGLRV